MGVVQSVTCTVPVLASGWEGLSLGPQRMILQKTLGKPYTIESSR